mmetsp:Transcript_47065/g.98680  ORF Transcript_47065/g.98680 Transcript_47065/m.98680 type:complete len:98 (-) Transcript_47065:251-544(-)
MGVAMTIVHPSVLPSSMDLDPRSFPCLIKRAAEVTLTLQLRHSDKGRKEANPQSNITSRQRMRVYKTINQKSNPKEKRPATKSESSSNVCNGSSRNI